MRCLRGLTGYGVRIMAKYFSPLLRRIADHPWGPLIVGLIAVLGNLAVAAWAGVPRPRVSDEFSYLFAADTYARGQLTNPPHPHWQHFEMAHVLSQPTFQSRYPMGQAVALALGQSILGEPAWGVWLTNAAMAAAVTWMLAAWVPRRWAFLAGLLFVLQFSLGHYWAQSYWGGALAGIAGAMLFGALKRLEKGPNRALAVIMAIGIAILSYTRLWEGLLASVLAGCALLMIIRKSEAGWRPWIVQIIVPMALILTLSMAWMGYYHYQVTGNALKLPHQLYADQYSPYPPFLWQRPKPSPGFNHQDMYDNAYVAEMSRWLDQRSVAGLLREISKETTFLWQTVLGFACTIPLLLLPVLLRQRDTWLPVVGALLMWGSLCVTTYGFPHYTTPCIGLLFVLIARGLQMMGLMTVSGQRVGLVLVVMIFVWQGAMAVGLAQEHIKSNANPAAWYQQRWAIEKELESTSGNHLAFVLYPPHHDLDMTVMANYGNLDERPVVWARLMTRAQNEALLTYFKDRQLWLIETEAHGVQVHRRPISKDELLALSPERLEIKPSHIEKSVQPAMR